MSLVKINKDNLKEFDKPLLIDFYASWCGPCRMVSPIIDEIADERDDVAVAKVNVDDEPELAGLFNVYSIPTLVVIKDGVESARSKGFRPKGGILELLES